MVLAHWPLDEVTFWRSRAVCLTHVQFTNIKVQKWTFAAEIFRVLAPGMTTGHRDLRKTIFAWHARVTDDQANFEMQMKV